MDMQLKTLLDELEIANQNFSNAESDYVNIATYELMAAEGKLNNYLKEKKTSQSAN